MIRSIPYLISAGAVLASSSPAADIPGSPWWTPIVEKYGVGGLIIVALVWSVKRMERLESVRNQLNTQMLDLQKENSGKIEDLLTKSLHTITENTDVVRELKNVVGRCPGAKTTLV
jgi:hypothetical protein